MYKHCATEAGEQRQRQFEQALLERMALQPYRQISVGELCSGMGLSRKAFYRYFSSLEDCLTALIDHTVMEMLALEVRSGEEGARLCFSFWLEHRELLEALCRNGLMELFMRRAWVCAGQAPDSRMFAWASRPEQMTFLVCGFVGMLVQWQMEGFRQSPAQLAQALGELLG